MELPLGLTAAWAGDRRKIVGLYALLLGANLIAWAAAIVEFGQRADLLAIAVLAYALGLRHAVDADHIAAIDNVVRKLMQEGKRPLAVGLFFSLGHSTLVVATVAIVVVAASVPARFAAMREIGGAVGSGVSATFLLAIALANAFILRDVWRQFLRVRRGERAEAEDLDGLLGRGLLARLFRPLFRMISASWHMFPIGLLFALGFDTATEVGLLGIAAAQTAQGLSAWSILIFPALFAAGMVLIDTTDGVFMVGAYGWAFANPLRKLWYNLTITAVSVLVAVLIGGIEALSVVADKLALQGAFWSAVGDL
ncbi:MAG TPA: HoxN/HupN/NixA family nickel/cobalt transporter, partial [Xanthobacteraceae bacterium]|nr:HoxN/HupN/NixA family nickel/cobalt transporter [Xanthobacteraceae bacterium]